MRTLSPFLLELSPIVTGTNLYLLITDVLMKKYLIIVLLLVFAFPGISNAQKAGLKTNALYWATTTPNLGLEVGMGDRFSFYLEGGYSPWTFNKDIEVNRKMKHFLVSPEVRYWFCESFNGHFVGINANYTQFNLSSITVPAIFYALNDPSGFAGSKNTVRNQGWAAGAGITYGYQWILGKRWNLEATVGLGYWYTVYDQFENRKCGLFQESFERHLIGPTRCGLSFIYLFN